MLALEKELGVQSPLGYRTLESVLSHLPVVPAKAVFRVREGYEKLAHNSHILAPGLYLTHKPILRIQGYTEERMLGLYRGEDPRIDVVCSVWHVEHMGEVGITRYEVLTEHSASRTRPPPSVERIHALRDLVVHSREEQAGRVRTILCPRIL